MGPAPPGADDLGYDGYDRYDRRQVGPALPGADDLGYDGYDRYDRYDGRAVGPALPGAEDLGYDWYDRYDGRQVGPALLGADDLGYDGYDRYDRRQVGPAPPGADDLGYDGYDGRAVGPGTAWGRRSQGRRCDRCDCRQVGYCRFCDPSMRASTSFLQWVLADARPTGAVHLARTVRGVGAMAAARHYRDLIAWQLAELFATEVQLLVHSSDGAQADFRYRDQLLGAAEGIGSNIAEGFLRFSPADFARFLTYALGSLAEAETRLEHGVRRGYFSPAATIAAGQLARRALTAIVRLKQSQTHRHQSER